MDITYIAPAIRDFVEEYYWVILKIWSLLRTEIENRRREPVPPNYMEHLENMENKAAEFAEKKYPGVYKMFYPHSDSVDSHKEGAKQA
jgi:hypothetical protein